VEVEKQPAERAKQWPEAVNAGKLRSLKSTCSATNLLYESLQSHSTVV
jgi:hypothetical protein